MQVSSDVNNPTRQQANEPTNQPAKTARKKNHLEALQLLPAVVVEHPDPKIRAARDEAVPPRVQGRTSLVAKVDRHHVALQLREVPWGDGGMSSVVRRIEITVLKCGVSTCYLGKGSRYLVRKTSKSTGHL